VLGGILEIVGLLALLVAAAEALTRLTAPRRRNHQPSLEDRHCPWPRLEPEVEALRRKGAL
jgi:hypothetical protein